MGEWTRLRPGDWVTHVWLADDRVTYRVARGRFGWAVSRSVAGAEQRTAVLGDHKTLREAKAAVQADWEAGL